jgi:hypothetical protein
MITNYKTPVLVDGTVTTIPSGVQDVNVTSPDPLPVSGTIAPEKSFNATTTPITVTTVSISLLGTNANRKGLVIQTNGPIFVRLDGTASTSVYSYELTTKAVLEIENYCGPVTAIKNTGSTTVLVTEKI